MIDDLTIAANGGFESSPFGGRIGIAAAAPRLSSDFEDLLHRSASLSADKPSARSSRVRPDDEPRTPAAADSASREAADDPDDLADRDWHADGDPARRAARDPIPADGYDDHPADVPEPDRASGGRDQAGDAVSETGAEPADNDSAAVGDGGVRADPHAGPKHPSAAASTPGSRGVMPTETPDTAARTETVSPFDESLLKSARANPQRPPGPISPQEARSMAPAETTAAAQRQAGGLAKAVGTGARARVSVNVVKEAETLVSRPSFTLASAVATAGDGGRPNPRATANSGQADAAPGTPLHPAAARVQSQTAGTQQTPAPHPGQAGATTQAATTTQAGAGSVPNIAAGSAVAPTETVDGDAAGLANALNNPRGTGPAAMRANGAGKLAPQHRPVADQISVHIGKAVKAGVDRIEIRLKPESLGRVDVRLEVARDGRVIVAVTAENRDTLELLRSDARGLERALQDAGLKADSGSLSFNLRGHDTAARQGGGSDPNPPAAETDDGGADDGDEPTTAPSAAYPQGGVTPDGRIDIRA